MVVLEEEEEGGSDHTPDHTQEDVVDSSGELGDSGVTAGKAQVHVRERLSQSQPQPTRYVGMRLKTCTLVHFLL